MTKEQKLHTIKLNQENGWTSVKVITIQKMAEKVNAPTGTLRQWESDFNLKIERDHNGARIYSLEQIELFKKIKSLRDKDVPKYKINEIIQAEMEMAATIDESKTDISNFTSKQLLAELFSTNRILEMSDDDFKSIEDLCNLSIQLRKSKNEINTLLENLPR